MDEPHIERLRQERQDLREEENAEGLEAGREWAGYAHYREVEAIALIDSTHWEGWSDAQKDLYRTLKHDEPVWGSDISEMAEELFGCRRPKLSWLRGWMQGVAEVFAHV
ncbi:hypothetical protein [Altererythrobacter sp. Root672]|uniref:hypothetical protein n=1 Tax=Altererythrobacter sp. Root672 TaxID=1736584 RepID=UPI0006FBCFDD|nr:hypothetical protein [Altererythrobacter sp. Root672]KRA84221.1 hypothetical protein ASD76_09615 [Altererythrobacter sp. Root672]